MKLPSALCCDVKPPRISKQSDELLKLMKLARSLLFVWSLSQMEQQLTLGHSLLHFPCWATAVPPPHEVPVKANPPRLGLQTHGILCWEVGGI